MIDVHLLVEIKSKIRRRKKTSVYSKLKRTAHKKSPMSRAHTSLYSFYRQTIGKPIEIQQQQQRQQQNCKMAVRLNLMHKRFEIDDLECKRFITFDSTK